MRTTSPSGARRLLICGPLLGATDEGGLPIALEDLASALRNLGWIVDLALTPASLGLAGDLRHVGLAPRRRLTLPALSRLPDDVRLFAHHLTFGGGIARAQSDAMRALETRLATEHYAAVIAHVYKFAPGLARFALARHPRVLLTSLGGLAAELRLARWLRAPRALKRLTGHSLHDDLYRPVAPEDVRLAAFASDGWRDDAVRAGLPRGVTRVIHFGVRRPSPLASLSPGANRLLWVGRCSPEKGLHIFIEALAAVRRTRPATLTAICGDGRADYRRDIERRIERHGLRGAVTLRSSVPRTELRALYGTHDALLFHSVYRDPVALVLMEAFGAGLPVIAPWRPAGAALVAPDDTVVAYATAAPDEVASAIARALDDEGLRRRVRHRAHARVVRDFTLDAMGRKFDEALSSLVADTRAPTRESLAGTHLHG